MPSLLVADGTVRLHYDVVGDGAETIVFAHGLLWSGRMFEEQVAALSSRYRCVTFDFRGQGESEMSRGGYDMDTLTDDAAEVIAHVAAAPCHFVGLSMGGFVGMRLALRKPGLIRSLVLVNTAADGEPQRNVPKYRAMALVARAVGQKPLASRILRIMFGSTFLADRDRAARREEMRARLLGNDPTAMARALEGIVTRPPLDEEVPGIAVPTTVIAGADDRAIARARSQRLADLIPNARYVVVPRAGHTSTVEEPALVTRAIEEHLARVAAPATATR